MKVSALLAMTICLLSGIAHADLDSELSARNQARQKAEEAAHWKTVNSENRRIAISILGNSVVKTENTHTYCIEGRDGSVMDGWDFRSVLAKMRDGRICLITNCPGTATLDYCE